MFSEKQEIIKAYFQGGNAKDQNHQEIRRVMEQIIEVIREEEKKEKEERSSN